MFSINFQKIDCSFAENISFEKSNMAAKMAICCESAVAIATAFKNKS